MASSGKLRPRSMFWHQSRIASGSVTRCLMNMRSSPGTSRKNWWNFFSSSFLSGRNVDWKLSLRTIFFGNFWTSSSIDMFALSLLLQCSQRTPPLSIEPRRFSGDAARLFKEPFINGRGIKAPARREQGDFFGVDRDDVGLAEQRTLGRLKVMETFQAQLQFRAGLDALIPQCFSRPGVRAHHAARLGARPCVMADHAVGGEELDVPQLAAQIEQETKASIHVITRIRQTGADNKNPAVDRWRDEKFLLAGDSFEPGAGLGIVQRQRGLNRAQVAAANRQPRGGPMLKNHVRRNEIRSEPQAGNGCLRSQKSASPSPVQRQGSQNRAAPQHHAEQDEKQNRD